MYVWFFPIRICTFRCLFENNLVHQTDIRSAQWSVKIIKSLHETTSPHFNFLKTLHVVVLIQFPKAKHTEFGYAQMIDTDWSMKLFMQQLNSFNLSLLVILSRPLDNWRPCSLMIGSNNVWKIYLREKLCGKRWN